MTRRLALPLVVLALSLAFAGTAFGATDPGQSLFTKNCAGCHTLAAAKAKGKVGPNLDKLKPSLAIVTKQVTNGGGIMPAFKGKLSKSQIATVSKYVATKAGKK